MRNAGISLRIELKFNCGQVAQRDCQGHRNRLLSRFNFQGIMLLRSSIINHLRDSCTRITRSQALDCFKIHCVYLKGPFLCHHQCVQAPRCSEDVSLFAYTMAFAHTDVAPEQVSENELQEAELQATRSVQVFAVACVALWYCTHCHRSLAGQILTWPAPHVVDWARKLF